ncbi:MAG TPA: trypsin-like peptidase domain-containing protein [Syntrophomonadaceae bacterium]|nr:trypsin-like peptidase domain-containing protein [Syntrophomonadaceae bacterium]
MNRQVVRCLAVAVLSFLLGSRLLASQQPITNNASNKVNANQTTFVSSSSSTSVADIVASVGPAVVYIEADQSSSGRSRVSQGFWGWYMPQQVEKATGTGFIIDSNGYILTNQHVVENASSIKVKLQNQDKSYTASVVGQDHDLDVALLRIDASQLPTIALGDSDAMRIGDFVIAIGNPLGLDHTVTTGVVSAKGRPITIQDRNYKNLIQTDAAINPGNSGGPLINMQGQVIAINTAVSTDAQGIGFAIPINTAKSIMQELMTNGKVVRAYLGITMTDITPDVSTQMQLPDSAKGVVITQVMSNSPASQAGVKAGDVLSSIDGTAVTSTTQVQEYIQKQQVGKTVKLGITRSGQSISISAVLKEQS